ncbi:MAG: helix-turn-helix domain-containing protein [Victivallaceae bacterium]
MPDSPLRIAAAGHSVCSPQWSTKVELRVPHFRIYYIEDGGGAVTVCGKCYKLEKGFVYFIPGNQPFINHCDKQMNVRWLHGMPTTTLFESMLSKINFVLKWSFAEFAVFNDTFNRLGKTNLEKLNADWFELHALASCVLAKVLRFLENREVPAPIPVELENALEFINRRFTQNPSLQEIARQANYAPIYFHRLFKKYFTVSPHQYMERKRMALAHGLLVNSSRTIAEIAELSGYQNVFYFSMVFKKHFAISPGRMRKRKMLP